MAWDCFDRPGRSELACPSKMIGSPTAGHSRHVAYYFVGLILSEYPDLVSRTVNAMNVARFLL